MLQILAQDGVTGADLQSTGDGQLFQPLQPREKWINKRSALKTKVGDATPCVVLCFPYYNYS